MNRTIVAALLVLFCVRGALAENRVLVDHVPGGATPAIVVAVCKAALTNREWKVTAVGADSIDARLNHSNADAKIRIVFKDWRVLYEGSAIITIRTGLQQQTILKKNGEIPDRWVTYLRRDISTALATIPETPP